MDELYHYGILGQKWGVRRYENKDGTLTEAGKQRYGKSQNSEKKPRLTKRIGEKVKSSVANNYSVRQLKKQYKKSPSRMTDEELKRRIERLRLEEEYRRLSGQQTLEQGRKLADSLEQKWKTSATDAFGSVVKKVADRGSTANIAARASLRNAKNNSLKQKMAEDGYNVSKKILSAVGKASWSVAKGTGKAVWAITKGAGRTVRNAMHRSRH